MQLIAFLVSLSVRSLPCQAALSEPLTDPVARCTVVGTTKGRGHMILLPAARPRSLWRFGRRERDRRRMVFTMRRLVARIQPCSQVVT
jgi:hypothetical protein